MCTFVSVLLLQFSHGTAADIRVVDANALQVKPLKSEGWTLIEEGNSKGQTFSVKDSVTLTAVTLQTKEVSVPRELTLRFVAVREGVPNGESLHEQSGKLPEGLGTGQVIRINLEKPLTLAPGTYAFILSTVDSKLKFAVGDVHRAGRLIRKNKATKGEWAVGARGKSNDLVFVLTGLPTEVMDAEPDLKSVANPSAKETAKEEDLEAQGGR